MVVGRGKGGRTPHAQHLGGTCRPSNTFPAHLPASYPRPLRDMLMTRTRTARLRVLAPRVLRSGGAYSSTCDLPAATTQLAGSGRGWAAGLISSPPAALPTSSCVPDVVAARRHLALRHLFDARHGAERHSSHALRIAFIKIGLRALHCATRCTISRFSAPHACRRARTRHYYLHLNRMPVDNSFSKILTGSPVPFIFCRATSLLC